MKSLSILITASILATAAAHAAPGDTTTTCNNVSLSDCLAFDADTGVPDSEAEPIIGMDMEKAQRWLEKRGWVLDIRKNGSNFYKRDGHILDIWFDNDSYEVCSFRDVNGDVTQEINQCDD